MDTKEQILITNVTRLPCGCSWRRVESSLRGVLSLDGETCPQCLYSDVREAMISRLAQLTLFPAEEALTNGSDRG